MAILAEKALMRILSSRLRMGRNREERGLKERRKRESGKGWRRKKNESKQRSQEKIYIDGE